MIAMLLRRVIALLAGVAGLVSCAAIAQTSSLPLAGDLTPVHDPVIIREGYTYHVFSTGIGPGGQGAISARRSRDRIV